MTWSRPGREEEVATVTGPGTEPGTEDEYRRQIGRRALLARTYLDMTQGEIATNADLTRNYVGAVERGAQGLDTWRLRRLAAALGVTPAWLLGLERPE